MHSLCKMASLLAGASWLGVCLAAPPSAADPAPVPALQHRSPLHEYRPLRDFSVGDWRAHNSRAAEAGGWRQYLRESVAAPAAQSTPGAKP